MNAPLNLLIDKKRRWNVLWNSHPIMPCPFYGQLMAGPQLLAYLLQVNYWLEHYRISLV